MNGKIRITSYHPNLLLHQVSHANGVTDTQANDPNSMRRPLSISSASSGLFASGWSSGNYLYDGAGNVTRIGSAWFTYDKVSRLTEGRVYLGPYGGGAQKWQTYTFDPFGNITTIGGTSGRSTPTSAATNRLTGTGTAYGPAGNLTAWNGATYQYDGFNQMTRMTNGGEDWLYLYTADDERLWSYSLNANFSRWTVRDLSGKILREWENHQNQYWGIAADTLYRDGQLLAAETGNGRKHFHLDHLGTPRLLTNAVGQKLAYHVYYPFGEEATEFNQDTERMKFTGHERDLGSLAGAGDDLDYMKARFCSPLTARFLAFDPGSSARPAAPQSWNKYVYANNNPIKNLDPDGRESRAALTLDQDIKAVLDGKMSSQEFQQRNQDRAKGAVAGLALVVPGPEDVALGIAAGTRLGSSILGRIGSFFGRGAKIFDRGGDASRAAARATDIEASGQRFFGKAPKGSQNFQTARNADGSTTFRYETPGRVPGSKAIYEKKVDAQGNTVRVHKRTLDPEGNLVHDKEKLKK
jgi:RHS repeat-associated protein